MAKEELELAIKSYKEGAVTLFELFYVKNNLLSLLLKRINLLLSLHNVYSQVISLRGWKK